ncbi:hypothetical protein [uncultured Jatrophihabitans sp.]|uniref:hypothetical protein n=1 Tax=uncultured Jatrophihabitans sp. TaxID=1610747 RepID=UPI0035CBA3B1
MSEADTDAAPPRAGMRLSRGRGAVSGVVLVLAGIWGAFIPFVGPSFHFAYTPHPHETWHWTAARGWYEVLPGGIAVLGGVLLILSANRIVTSFGAWIAALAGGWFVVGQQVSYLLTLGSPGAPSAAGDRRYVAEYLAFFTGLGALIILFAAVAIGRLSVHSTRDAQAAARRAAADQDSERPEDYTQDDYRRDEPSDDYRRDERSDDYPQDDYRQGAHDRPAAEHTGGAYPTGERSGGYGTPGTSGSSDGDQRSSAVTTELPLAGAGAAAGAGALYVGERLHDDSDHPDSDHADSDHPDSDRGNLSDRDADSADNDGRDNGGRETDSDRNAAYRAPEDVSPESTAPEPAAPEPAAPEPVGPAPDGPHPTEPQPVSPEPAGPQPTEPQPTEPQPVAPEPAPQTEPPFLLEPPEGHPDAERFRARAGAAGHDAPAPSEDSPQADQDAAAEPSQTWNPAEQSPTTTGEMPAFRSHGHDDPPPVSGRGVQQPRRYYGPNNPAPEADDGAGDDPGASSRDAVRTDETIDQDLDHEMDLDERPT